MLEQLEREGGVWLTQLQLGRLKGHLRQVHRLELQVGEGAKETANFSSASRVQRHQLLPFLSSMAVMQALSGIQAFMQDRC